MCCWLRDPVFSRFDTIPACGRQTERQTQIHDDSIYCDNIASCGWHRKQVRVSNPKPPLCLANECLTHVGIRNVCRITVLLTFRKLTFALQFLPTVWVCTVGYACYVGCGILFLVSSAWFYFAYLRYLFISLFIYLFIHSSVHVAFWSVLGPSSVNPYHVLVVTILLSDIHLPCTIYIIKITFINYG